jgi:2-dehydropantoate 2-reductase
MVQTIRKIAVVGPGAVGGTTAGILTSKGYDVTLACKYPEVASKISREGIHIHGLGKEMLVKVPTAPSIKELKGTFDLVLLATKAMDMAETAREALPLLHSGTKVVSMQNGIMEEELSEIVGRERTVGCVVGFGATMEAYGSIELTSHGDMWLGYMDRDPDPQLEEISGILNEVATTHTVERILPTRYAKLIINSCTSTLGVITGMELGPLLRKKQARELFVQVGREAIRVADAMGLKVPPYGGRIRFRTILNSPGPVQHVAIRIIGIRYRRMKSTNLQSLERGRVTEIEYLNGYIVKHGKSHNVKTPLNSKLLEMVREIEEKKRPISPGNLEDLKLWN